MNTLVNYIKKLLWTGDGNENIEIARKRDRDHNQDIVDDDRPTLKRFKGDISSVKSNFSDSFMISKGDRSGYSDSGRALTNPNVRYIKIQSGDSDYLGPSTSTPSRIPKTQNKGVDTSSLSRALPSEFSKHILPLKHSKNTVDFRSELQLAPDLETREFIPRSVTRDSVKTFNADDKYDVWLVDKRLNKSRIYVEHARDSKNTELLEITDDLDDDDDIVFVKQSNLQENGECEKDNFQKSTSSSLAEARSSITRNTPVENTLKMCYMLKSPNYRIMPSGDSNSSTRLLSPRHKRLSFGNGLFKAPQGPQGIIKSKHSYVMPQGIGRNFFPSPLQKRHSDSRLHSKFASQTAISETFRLDEKKDYRELIRKMGCNDRTPSLIFTERSTLQKPKPGAARKKSDVIDLTRTSSNKLSNGVGEMNGYKEHEPASTQSLNSSDSEVELIGSNDDALIISQKEVKRVNSFKKNMDDVAFVKTSWLSDLTDRYQNIHLDRNKLVTEAKGETEIICELNEKVYKKLTPQNLNVSVSLDEDDIIEKDAVLPELTAEQLKIINYIWNSSKNPDEVIIEKFRYSIKRRDLMTLDGLNWLNDEVINFYINLLIQRGQEKSMLPKVFGINTFFYPKLLASGQAGLKRWTRNVDIFAHDLMIIPVHLNVHWCMSVIDFRDKTIKYYDSMGGVNMACCNALLKYLEDEHMDRKKQPLDSKMWKKECVKNIPHQMNGSDCGMFACTFAEYICRNAKITFTQKDMPYFRRKMTLEIKLGKLLL